MRTGRVEPGGVGEPLIVRRIIIVGCLLGLAGLGLFATLHAIVLKPIWGELAGGIPFVIAIGISVAWAYHEFAKATPTRVSAGGGLRFGVLIWLSAWPATALANIMRVRGGAAPLPLWVDITAMVLALAGGAIALGLVAHSRRAAIAGAIAAGVLLAAAGGPLPVVRGGRVVELWVGLLVLETLGGVLLAQMYKRWVLPVALKAG